MCSDTKEVKLTFLHPHGPATPSSTRPLTIFAPYLWIILTLVDPRTRSGRVNSLTKQEMTAAKERLDSAT